MSDFLHQVLRSPLEPPSTTRPYVTLTFAQSLDAKISGNRGRQLILSGKESMVMTHWMRTMHDAILIGVGTALNDDPQLNTRHLPPTTVQSHSPPQTGDRFHLPRPIILDSNLRFLPTSKLIANFYSGHGRRPYIVCTPPEMHDTKYVLWSHRKELLERAGARIVEVMKEDSEAHPSLKATLFLLHGLGIRSVMVEGGATIINAFISSGSSENPLVDSVIVTVAPVFVGPGGVAYAQSILPGHSLSEIPAMQLEHVRTEVMGRDTVFGMRVAGAKSACAEAADTTEKP